MVALLVAGLVLLVGLAALCTPADARPDTWPSTGGRVPGYVALRPVPTS
jgi:hypothetical protein